MRDFPSRRVLRWAALPFIGACSHGEAQRRTPRIGFMIGSGYPGMESAFRDELNRLGYVEGHNLLVENRISNSPAELQAQTAEVASMDLDFIVVAALPQALAVRAANQDTSMVVATAAGLVENGFARSLSGRAEMLRAWTSCRRASRPTRLRLLKSAAPAITRIALLSTAPGRGGHEVQLC